MVNAMTDRRIILLLSTVVLVLGAGVVVGRLLAPRAPTAIATTQPDHPRPWFDQLQLSSEQRQEMDAIWNDTKQKLHNLNTMDRRHELDKARDMQIRSILSAEQQASYDQINADFHAKLDELDKQRQKLIDDANQRSRALLDDNQKKLWDEQSKRPHGRGSASTQRSTTRPWPAPPMGDHF
jgi:Spy/CpxP family protein refolding chaperone